MIIIVTGFKHVCSFVTPDATNEVSPSVDRALFFQRLCGLPRGAGTCEPLVRGRARQPIEGHRLSCNKRSCRLITGPQCRRRVGNAQSARHRLGTPDCVQTVWQALEFFQRQAQEDGEESESAGGSAVVRRRIGGGRPSGTSCGHPEAAQKQISVAGDPAVDACCCGETCGPSTPTLARNASDVAQDGKGPISHWSSRGTVFFFLKKRRRICAGTSWWRTCACFPRKGQTRAEVSGQWKTVWTSARITRMGGVGGSAVVHWGHREPRSQPRQL